MILKTSISQPDTITDRLDKGDIVGVANARSKLANAKDGKLFKSRNLSNNGATKEPQFLTIKTRETFNPLKQAFIEAPILLYFDLKYYIWIETDVSSYAISDVLSQLTFG